MIYLASPYSHPEPEVREQRFLAVCEVTSYLIRAGHAVFSPIVHSHPLTRFELPMDWSFWESLDRRYLERCDGVLILMLPGWEEGIGVQAEIELAQSLGKPVAHLSLEDISTDPNFFTTLSDSFRSKGVVD